MQCKGFLFDLDGTLVDSLPAVERAWCNWADRFNLDHDEVLGFIHGKQAITSLRHFMPGKSEAEIAAEFTRLEQIEATETAGITALPGAMDLLNHLNNAGIPWAIVTPVRCRSPVRAIRSRAFLRQKCLSPPNESNAASRSRMRICSARNCLAWRLRSAPWWKMPRLACCPGWLRAAMSLRSMRRLTRRV